MLKIVKSVLVILSVIEKYSKEVWAVEFRMVAGSFTRSAVPPQEVVLDG